jgi:hypothetical protein
MRLGRAIYIGFLMALAFVLLIACDQLANAQTSYQTGQVATSLNAVAATGAGAAFSLPMRDSGYPSVFTWQMVYTGTPSAITATLQGSIDNVNWFVLDTSTSTAGEMRSVAQKPVRFLRCNISAYTVNSSTATCSFIASRQ